MNQTVAAIREVQRILVSEQGSINPQAFQKMTRSLREAEQQLTREITTYTRMQQEQAPNRHRDQKKH